MKVKLFIFLSEETKTKINNFNIIVLIYHDVIEFYVPVSNSFRMQVLNTVNNSSEYFFGLLF